MQHVSSTDFSRRIASLTLSARGLPKKPADFNIILVSAICDLSPSRRYSEKELNADLQRWILQVGSNFGIDHVTLRRYLVDAGLLTRDTAGAEYSVRTSAHDFSFDPEIRAIDLPALLSAAKKERAERKLQRQAKVERL